MKTLRTTLALVLATASIAAAQTPCPTAPVADHGKPAVAGAPLASPAASATVLLGGKKITLTYNTPSKRCRTIFGGLVPYDKVWRTGANPATSFVTEANLKVGTLSVPAGAYTLYTLPEAPGTPWLLILNKQTGQWGTIYKPEMDLGRTPLKSATLPASQEVMSLTFEKVSGKHAELHIKWDTTDEFVPVTVE